MDICSHCKKESDELTAVRIKGGTFSQYRILHLCPDCLVEYAEAKKERECNFPSNPKPTESLIQ